MNANCIFRNFINSLNLPESSYLWRYLPCTFLCSWYNAFSLESGFLSAASVEANLLMRFFFFWSVWFRCSGATTSLCSRSWCCSSSWAESCGIYSESEPDSYVGAGFSNFVGQSSLKMAIFIYFGSGLTAFSGLRQCLILELITAISAPESELSLVFDSIIELLLPDLLIGLVLLGTFFLRYFLELITVIVTS